MSHLPTGQFVEVAERQMAKLDRIIERYIEPGNAFYDTSLEAVERFTVDMSPRELRHALAAALRVIRPIHEL